MPKLFRSETPRLLHLTIMGLLLFSVVQVVWWFYDQRAYADSRANEVKTLYGYDTLAAQRMAQLGAPAAEIAAIFPHVRFTGAEVPLAPEALAEIERARRAHIIQYTAESGFFLLVQAFAIAVLWRGLRAEAEIRRKQDNFLALV